LNSRGSIDGWASLIAIAVMFTFMGIILISLDKSCPKGIAHCAGEAAFQAKTDFIEGYKKQQNRD